MRATINYLRVTIINRYKFLAVLDLADINFSDFEIIYSINFFKNVATNLLSASTIFSEKQAIC